MPTTQQKATLTANQIAVLECALEPGTKRNIKAICSAAGVDRTRFYAWLKECPEFADAWANLWKDVISRHLPGIMASMVDKAQDGDVAAARLVVDVAGIIIRKSTIDVNWREEARKAGLDDAALFEQMVNSFGEHDATLAGTSDNGSMAGALTP